MTVSAQNIIPATPITDALVTYYTSEGVKTIIDKITIANPTNATTVFIDMYIVEDGGAANDTNILIKEQPVFPNETFTFPAVVGHTMKAGDILVVKGTNNQAVLRASGRLIS